MKRPPLLWLAAAALCVGGGVLHFRGAAPGVTPAAARSVVAGTAGHPAGPDRAIIGSAMSEPVAEPDWFAEATNAAVRLPARALDDVRQLLIRDPDDTNGLAGLVLISLCNAGQFKTALALALSGPEALRENWLRMALQQWAQRDPQAALAALAQVTDPQLHASAFVAAVTGWNATNPGGLAAYAEALPEGSERTLALGAAINNWSLQDPAGLTDWLNTLPSGPDFDLGVSAMLQRTDGANRSPAVAMAWVEAMSDATLKRNAFEQVLAEWGRSDPATALQYVANASWLDDSERLAAATKLGGTTPQ